MCYNALHFVRACMLASVAGGAVICSSASALAQATDPGPRPLMAAQVQLNTAPKTALSLSQEGFVSFDHPTTDFFNASVGRFQEVDSVSGTITTPFPETGNGLGPRFNANSCASCHVFPAVGGTSPPGNFVTTDAREEPSRETRRFRWRITARPTPYRPSSPRTGPVREARFVFNPDGTRDGGVHDLFTITGRTDAAGCNIAQPPLAQQLANHNVIFRIPTPTFGLGLVEKTPDGDQDNTIGLVAAANAQAGLRSSLGIAGASTSDVEPVTSRPRQHRRCPS